MRTLIVACSATKKSDAGLLPALARYDGPAYRTLRKNLEAAGELRVVILSAEFGLLEPDAEIPDYNRKLTLERARELAPRVSRELQRMAELGELAGGIFVFGSGLYRNILKGGLAAAGAHDRTRFSAGGIGEQLGQLKAFLLEGAPA
jgi:hypothetical protein